MLTKPQCLNGSRIRVDLDNANSEPHEILFALGVELKKPLTILKSNVQLLEKHCVKADDLFTGESFELCEYALDNIRCFIDYLMFLCDPKEDCYLPKISCFDLKPLLDYILDDLKKKNFDSSRIKVQIALKPVICSDKFLLIRILTNLLCNALKFSQANVDLNICEANQKLQMTICDQGIGIPPDEITNIFQPFCRASNVRYIPGSGLGLSLVSKSVKMLGGSLFVSSVPDAGSEFNVMIPFQTGERPKAPRKRVIHLKREVQKSALVDNQMQLW